MKMRLACLCLVLCPALFLVAQTAAPTAVSPVPNVSSEVPHLIRFSGQIRSATGTVGITFTLHKAQDDSTALWIETQNVALDATGKYTVLLGATKPAGIPTDLFISGEAQWLAIQVQGQPEQSRVLLVSVPYALKAAEAETLAGHAASDFVTSDKVSTIVQQQLLNSATIPPAKRNTPANPTTPISQGPTAFSGSTTNNIVSVTQTSTGTALTAIAPGTAVYGTSTNTSGNAYGVKGASASSSGFGVYGLNTATTGSAVGIYGQSGSNAGVALSGVETSTTGVTKGIVATVESPSGIGMVVQNTATGGALITGETGTSHTPVFTVDGSGNIATTGGISLGSLSAPGDPIDATTTSAGYAGHFVSTTSFGVGLFGNGYYGVYADGTTYGLYANGDTYGVYGSSTTKGAYAVYGENDAGYAVYGYNDTTAYPAAEFNNPAGAGTATTGNALRAFAGGGATGDDHPGAKFLPGAGEFSGPNGVIGAASSDTTNGVGVLGLATTGNNGVGVFGYNSEAQGAAIYASDASGKTTSYAGYFLGNVEITGTLNGGTPAARLDDPLDPANKYLTQASVISSEMLSMYSGTVVLDASGSATVQLPRYFEALNKDFRYQLTCIGGYAPVYVASEVTNNSFSIAGGKPGMKVSWQVSGVRHDAYAAAHPLVAEEAKPANEAGRYLHPLELGASPKLAIGRSPQLDFHHEPNGAPVPPPKKVPPQARPNLPTR